MKLKLFLCNGFLSIFSTSYAAENEVLKESGPNITYTNEQNLSKTTNDLLEDKKINEEKAKEMKLDHNLEIGKLIHKNLDEFSKYDSTKSPIIVHEKFENRDITIIGVHKNIQKKIDLSDLKKYIAKSMGLPSKKMIQIVGDSNQFSEEGTIAGRELLTPYFKGEHILEYGFTGYLNEKQLDINSFLNEYINHHPEEAYKVFANTVGHTVLALEKWGCKVSNAVNVYSVVFDENGMGDGFTKFGDDTDLTDLIMNPEDGDILLMLEGGPQSFKQAVNVLENDVEVKAAFNFRTNDRRKYFSAAEFFFFVKEMLKKDKELSSEDVKSMLKDYLKTHEAWDPKKNDAETKEKQFYPTVERFASQGLYPKLLNMDITLIDPDGYIKNMDESFKPFMQKYGIEIPTTLIEIKDSNL